jgi:hypothetical protein
MLKAFGNILSEIIFGHKEWAATGGLIYYIMRISIIVYIALHCSGN